MTQLKHVVTCKWHDSKIFEEKRVCIKITDRQYLIKSIGDEDFFAKFTTHVMIWIFSNTAFISAPSVFIVCWHFSNLSCSPGTSKYSRAPKIPPSHRRKGQNTKHFMKRRSRTLQWFTSFTKSLVSYATPETSYTVKSKLNVKPILFYQF